MRSGGAPQPRLTFRDGNDQAEVEPAPIDTLDLMIATRRATAAVDGEGAPRDQFVRLVATELGYQRTPKPVAKAIDNSLLAASRRGILYTEQGRVFADCRTIADYPRDLLKQTLLSVVGHTWTTRDEAITLAARHFGFERTGKRIKAALKSAITGLLRQEALEHSGQHLRRR